MRVALTGTPGTGKTSVSQELSRLVQMPVVDLNAVLSREFPMGRDLDRDTLVVDVHRAASELKLPDNCVVEGHLSHLFPVDAVVVLRCKPKELYQRLAAKGWPARKVEENVEAEALNIVSEEARENNGRVWDIDTTQKSPAETAQLVRMALDGELLPEQLDFLEFL